MSHERLRVGTDGVTRCWWCGDDPLYVHYHDEEWGHPVTNDVRLFEKFCLEGFQSGLSWLTILRKREHFRVAFAGFEIAKVAAFDEGDVERLLGDAGIVRHRGKIQSTINNAQRALVLLDEFGSIYDYVSQYRPARTTRLTVHGELFATCPESVAMSKDLKKRGWSFVGPTTMYAFMQAMGLINDHIEGCEREP
ncbi:MAG: DNA-3-methyladenine glycosylase I [Ilumatobacteraceae bacterium]